MPSEGELLFVFHKPEISNPSIYMKILTVDPYGYGRLG